METIRETWRLNETSEHIIRDLKTQLEYRLDTQRTDRSLGYFIKHLV